MERSRPQDGAAFLLWSKDSGPARVCANRADVAARCAATSPPIWPR